MGASGQLGYGIPEAAFRRGVAETDHPDTELVRRHPEPYADAGDQRELSEMLAEVADLLNPPAS